MVHHPSHHCTTGWLFNVVPTNCRINQTDVTHRRGRGLLMSLMNNRFYYPFKLDRTCGPITLGSLFLCLQKIKFIYSGPLSALHEREGEYICQSGGLCALPESLASNLPVSSFVDRRAPGQYPSHCIVVWCANFEPIEQNATWVLHTTGWTCALKETVFPYLELHCPDWATTVI